MAKYQPKIPPADHDALQSWRKKILLDTSHDALGVVVDINVASDPITLIARFQNDSDNRVIAIEPTAGIEYIFPGDVRARYRVATAEDIERIKSVQAA